MALETLSSTWLSCPRRAAGYLSFMTQSTDGALLSMWYDSLTVTAQDHRLLIPRGRIRKSLHEAYVSTNPPDSLPSHARLFSYCLVSSLPLDILPSCVGEKVPPSDRSGRLISLLCHPSKSSQRTTTSLDLFLCPIIKSFRRTSVCATSKYRSLFLTI